MALSTVARQRMLFLVLCVVWGATWLAMKAGTAEVPPALFSGLRWAVAGAVLLAWRHWRGHSIRMSRRLFARLTVVAAAMVGVNAVANVYGLRYVGSGLAAVINCGLTPMGLLAFSVLARQERFTPRQGLGMAVGVAGILLLFGPKARAGDLGMEELIGAALIFVATLAYCAGSVLARPLMRTLPPAQVAAVTNFVGGVMLLVGALAFEPGAWTALNLNWGWQAWAGWWFLLVPGSLGATLIYFVLVRDWGASRAGTYAFISPVVAVLLGVALGGEVVEPMDAAGMALMLLAAFITLRGRA